MWPHKVHKLERSIKLSYFKKGLIYVYNSRELADQTTKGGKKGDCILFFKLPVIFYPLNSIFSVVINKCCERRQSWPMALEGCENSRYFHAYPRHSVPKVCLLWITKCMLPKKITMALQGPEHKSRKHLNSSPTSRRNEIRAQATLRVNSNVNALLPLKQW